MKIQNGDVVWTPARGIAKVRHYGIWDEAMAQFLHNNTPHGVQYAMPEEFINGVLHIEKRPHPGWDQEVIRRARALIGSDYDLLTFNCEHYVNYVTEGQKTSPQLQNAMATTLLGGIAAFALREIFGPQYDESVDRYRDRKGRFVSR